MGVGQGALASLETLERMRVVELGLACDELDRGAVHARTLRHVLELNALLVADGMGIAAASQIALSLSCSENRAARLLVEAQGLVELPGALEAVECGLLTVEQCATVVEQLKVLDLPGRLAVWRRLRRYLIAQADAGAVSPPARLADRLRNWVMAHDREPPAPPTRPLRPLPGPHPFDELSPLQIEHALATLGLLPDDPEAYELRATDVEHPDDIDPDRVDIWGQPADTTWTTDLHDPYRWAEPAH